MQVGCLLYGMLRWCNKADDYSNFFFFSGISYCIFPQEINQFTTWILVIKDTGTMFIVWHAFEMKSCCLFETSTLEIQFSCLIVLWFIFFWHSINYAGELTTILSNFKFNIDISRVSILRSLFRLHLLPTSFDRLRLLTFKFFFGSAIVFVYRSGKSLI